METGGMKKSLQALLIGLIVIALILGGIGGWYITDKYLAGVEDPIKNTECEPCDMYARCPNEEKIDSQYVGKYIGESKSEVSEDSYIIINADGTFETILNYCEGFYTIKGNVYVRHYDKSGVKVPVLNLLANDGNDMQTIFSTQLEYIDNSLEYVAYGVDEGYDCSFATVFKKQ